MRTFVFLIIFMFSPAALAVNAELGFDETDVNRMQNMEYAAHAICRLPNYPEKLSNAACDVRTELRKTLFELGYKFDLGERIWVKK